MAFAYKLNNEWMYYLSFSLLDFCASLFTYEYIPQLEYFA